MDFYISMAVAVVLQALRDKGKDKKVWPVMLKVYRSIKAYAEMNNLPLE